MVKHIVLLKFKAEISEEQVTKFFDDLLEVTENIPGVDDYISGTNISSEGFNQGFTHGAVLTFGDTAARDAYLAHPEHEKFKAAALPMVDSVLVFDFEV